MTDHDTAAPRAGTPPRPVGSTERIESIDVLRGFAVLGILVMNIRTFAMVSAAYFNPTAYGDLAGPNYVVWLLGHLLVDQKFMTIFSMLFGAGIVLMSERGEARGPGWTAVHYRRMGWLALFGILHAHLLWYGDILYFYGLCGMIVYPLRRLRPRNLVIVGLLSIAVASCVSVLFGLSMEFWPEDVIAEFTLDWQPDEATIEEELSAYRGGWLSQATHRSPAALEFETFLFAIWGVWRVGGVMLLGMALFKLGILGARRSRELYLALAAIGMLVGVPAVFVGVRLFEAADWSLEYSFFFGGQFNYWASLLVALGWIGLVMLVCQRGWGVTRPLAAVGRMALTNYVMQTLICTTLFYGHGLGMIGRVEHVGQIAVVVGIWIVQLVLSPLWLQRFRYGPFEWLWRSLTYRQLQPMRRAEPRFER